MRTLRIYATRAVLHVGTDGASWTFQLPLPKGPPAEQRRHLILQTRPDSLAEYHPVTGNPVTHAVLWGLDGTYAVAHDTREVGA